MSEVPQDFEVAGRDIEGSLFGEVLKEEGFTFFFIRLKFPSD